MSAKTTDGAWQEARLLWRLQDTPEARMAFYSGARHSLDVVIDDDSEESLLALNDELSAFGNAAISSEQRA